MDSLPVSFGWPSPAPRTTARLFFFTAFILTVAAFIQLASQGAGSGHDIGQYSWKFIFLLASALVLAVVLLGLLLGLLFRYEEHLTRLYQSVLRQMERGGAWNYLGLADVLILYVFVVIWSFDESFQSYLPRLWAFFLITGFGAMFFLAASKKLSFFWAFLATGVIYGLALKALSYLPEVSSDPFSLAWSEASRYYYGSLPLSRWLYGISIPLSPMHASRYLLLSLPFLIPGSPIVLHRLWQVFLWLALSLGTGYVLARRVGIRSTGARLLFTAWAALFLLQGPVYYHLLISVILVIAGFDRGKFWKSLVYIVLASAWAGISRVNWFPVPAFIALTLYLLERPLCSPNLRGWWRYFRAPLAWAAAGGAAAVAAQGLYVLLSGHEDISQFGSTFTSDLLWYRLLPSPTSGLGILPIILIVTLPLLLAVTGSWQRSRGDWHGLRLLGIGGMVLVLFGGGLVVSTKIGGGSNIHNLDAYMVLLLITGAYILFRRPLSERGGPAPAWLPWLLALLIASMPVLWNINIGRPFLAGDRQQSAIDLALVQRYVNEYTGKGEILFITQRQLQVFHSIKSPPMIPEYELLTLSEMSISNNQAYLQDFRTDLANHRFALIIADTQHKEIQDPRVDAFAEENNAWVTNISRPIQTYYRSEKLITAEGINIYVPKP